MIFRLNRLFAAYTRGSQLPLLHENTAQMFNRVTNLNPHKTLVNSHHQNLSLTYAQVQDKAKRVAGFIRQLGLQDFDRVGVLSYNTAEWLIMQLACAMSNTILVNINPAYQKEELLFCLKQVGVSILMADHIYHKHNYLNDLLVPLFPQLLTQSSLNPRQGLQMKYVISLDPQCRQGKLLNFSDLLAPESKRLNEVQEIMARIPTEAPTNIQFTSGTTGKPKGATLSHFNIINNGYVLGQRTKYSSQDNICISVPLYHCFGMVMGNLAAITRGMTVTYPCKGFNAKKALQASQRYKCTSMYGVPTMFIDYLKQVQEKDYKLELRTGVMAGSLCPEVLMKNVYNKLKLHDFTICYGMTQTSPISFQTSPQDSFVQKTQTVGKILPAIQAKIVDQNKQTVDFGVPGELWVRGYSVMLGYWKDQLKTKESIEQGWMKTGDLCSLDKEGYLTIVGRIKDMIIRGGENVYPKEIEDKLREMTEIEDAQIIGVKDERMGEQVVAYIKLKKGKTLDKKQVNDFLFGKIANYKIPKYIKFSEDLPTTVTGKVQKFLMRKEFQQQLKAGKQHLYKVR